jgi:hypothetical protein
LQHVHAVLLGQLDVEADEIGRCAADGFEGGLAVLGEPDVEVLAAEQAAEEIPDRLLVLDDKNRHRTNGVRRDREMK